MLTAALIANAFRIAREILLAVLANIRLTATTEINVRRRINASDRISAGLAFGQAGRTLRQA